MHDAEVVVQYFGDRCQAVGGAASHVDDLHVRAERFVVHTQNEGHIDALTGGRHQHELRAAFDMFGCFFALAEHARAFKHVVYAQVTPGDVRWITLRKHTHLVAVDRQRAFVVRYSAVESAVDRVIFE